MPKEKVVVVMGATGTGKTRLSIDLATRFEAEIINSDKIQVHQGLEITTNKITDEERCGVPHHILGITDPDSDFSVGDFCDAALVSIKSILSRNKLPIIVGGSNSFVEALVDVNFQSKYDCCFLWMDVAMPVLHSYVCDRVDKMVERGMVDEVRNFYDPNADYSKGIRRAIGVSELDEFFRMEWICGKETRETFLEKAIDSIKINTCKLAERQLNKIQQLNVKWNIHRFDATDVFQKREGEEGEMDAAWRNTIAAAGIEVVSNFLYDLNPTYTPIRHIGEVRTHIGEVRRSIILTDLMV
ncbi:Adenylate isopentenyltransferase 3-chloroplastic [Striga hermonthica]|uniref:adenylate dimethylallyltransferase (ADP/ATP-dependent) n=1 Tax=Striga hermonthica TaxID=68872 RepID=A0A9N7NDI8_STRHE|nr:Adenylate isopentenyltransferase 3-chloroplastic [Striga hermonthica]